MEFLSEGSNGSCSRNPNVQTIRATYSDNYERLQQVDTKDDPDNVFHVNQHVEPTA